MFSVDVDIDVNTNFYLNTRDSGSLIIFLLRLGAMTHPCNLLSLTPVTVNISRQNNHSDQTELMRAPAAAAMLVEETNGGLFHSHF